MNIALTGTPGTGKTSLSSKFDYNLVSINDYYAEISNGKDEKDNWLLYSGAIQMNWKKDYLTEVTVMKKLEKIWKLKLSI